MRGATRSTGAGQVAGFSSTSPITPPVRPKSANIGKRAAKPFKDDSTGRVRVAVRLRPQNVEELAADEDSADCVELQPELKRLKLRKNNWNSETFQFDEVFTETASQKRVYEVVAKPVVESALNGYNGTVMAYGQTGTGKTFTLGQLGEKDSSSRGIMVRALEDILADTNPDLDTVTVSYLQLYLDTVQDLLAPEKANIPIVEDPKWGDISLPGATIVQVHDCKSFMQLLQTGEANRFAANTKMNTESSRSHAILLIYINKSVKEEEGNEFPLPIENDSSSQLSKMHSATSIRKSKLLIVDLAGSERIDKSGSEGHTLEEAKCINLSLTALGKCINALAENSSHIPARDSKLTRLLRDSFGGTARTSLVVTISPSPQHRGETTSTIMFGQRAMKVENMVKLKEEFDYKSLCHKLESQVDFLTIHNERQTKLALDTKQDMEKKFHEFQRSLVEAEKNFSTSFEKELQAEKQMHRIEIGSISELHQQEISEIREKLEVVCCENELLKKELFAAKQNLSEKNEKIDKELQAEQQMHRIELGSISELHQQEILEIREKLEAVCHENELLNKELFAAKRTLSEKNEKIDARYDGEIQNMRQTLKEDQKHREILEDEVHMLKEQSLQLNCDLNENRKSVEDSGKLSIGSKIPITLLKSSQSRDTTSAQRATIAKLFEGVGLPKILSYFRSEDVDVQIHAAKVVANLAARESNQEKIVEAGGLGSLLMLLGTSEDETIQRVAAGAIANLAMNERNQELIMNQGGIKLLAKIANEAEDPQTLRMVGGAVANLCGNNKLQMRLKDEGGIKSLLGMVRSSHLDVLAQVARGFANLAKCESRGVTQGHQKGRSLLIDDGALDWIVANSNNQANPIRRHIEVALCHLSQHEANARDIVACGALRELVRISRECSREDIRNLAKRTLYSNPTFQVELRRMHLPHK